MQFANNNNGNPPQMPQFNSESTPAFQYNTNTQFNQDGANQ
jgi:hypothetical protein